MKIYPISGNKKVVIYLNEAKPPRITIQGFLYFRLELDKLAIAVSLCGWQTFPFWANLIFNPPSFLYFNYLHYYLNFRFSTPLFGFLFELRA